jgi:hypothetical protein
MAEISGVVAGAVSTHIRGAARQTHQRMQVNIQRPLVDMRSDNSARTTLPVTLGKTARVRYRSCGTPSDGHRAKEAIYDALVQSSLSLSLENSVAVGGSISFPFAARGEYSSRVFSHPYLIWNPETSALAHLRGALVRRDSSAV